MDLQTPILWSFWLFWQHTINQLKSDFELDLYTFEVKHLRFKKRDLGVTKYNHPATIQPPCNHHATKSVPIKRKQYNVYIEREKQWTKRTSAANSGYFPALETWMRVQNHASVMFLITHKTGTMYKKEQQWSWIVPHSSFYFTELYKR